MRIIINTSSMVPIYEQLIDQIKTLIRKSELKENDSLPSVRTLAKELKISALIKTDNEEYNKLDKQYLLSTKSEAYGYSCLTNQKQYYIENYPGITVQKATVDDVIMMLIKGEDQ